MVAPDLAGNLFYRQGGKCRERGPRGRVVGGDGLGSRVRVSRITQTGMRWRKSNELNLPTDCPDAFRREAPRIYPDAPGAAVQKWRAPR